MAGAGRSDCTLICKWKYFQKRHTEKPDRPTFACLTYCRILRGKGGKGFQWEESTKHNFRPGCVYHHWQPTILSRIPTLSHVHRWQLKSPTPMESWRTPTRICPLWPLRRWKAPPSATFFQSVTAVEMRVWTCLIKRCLGCMVQFFCGFGNRAHGWFLAGSSLPYDAFGGVILDTSAQWQRLMRCNDVTKNCGLARLFKFKANHRYHRTSSSLFPSHSQFDSHLIPA